MLVALASTLPVVEVGALAVQMHTEVDFRVEQLGIAVGAYFASAVVLAPLLGRRIEQLGAPASMLIAVAISSTSLSAIAFAVDSYLGLVGALAVGGIANAIAQPATNLFLSELPAGQQGRAFGMKQAAMPLAGVIAGLSVPTLGTWLGWRAVFGISAGAVVCLLVPLRSGIQERSNGHVLRRRTEKIPLPVPALTLLAIGSALGSGAAACLTGFLTSSSVAAGFSAGAAGVLLTSGALICVAIRIVCGVWADRSSAKLLPAVCVMLLVGSAGYLMVATGGTTAVAAGAILAYAFGWGWAGLFILAVVRANTVAPAAATGLTQAGTSLGAVVGPLSFGFVVSHSSYGRAWLVASLAGLVAAIAMSLGQRALNGVAGPAYRGPRVRSRARRGSWVTRRTALQSACDFGSSEPTATRHLDRRVRSESEY